MYDAEEVHITCTLILISNSFIRKVRKGMERGGQREEMKSHLDKDTLKTTFDILLRLQLWAHLIQVLIKFVSCIYRDILGSINL